MPREADDAVTTLLRTGLRVTPPGTASFELQVTHGLDAGQSFRIGAAGPSRTLLGQGPACAVQLSDPAVSRRHLSLDVDELGLHVVDLGSKNGTLVNDVRVLEAVLVGGERLSVGSTTLKVERHELGAEPNIPVESAFGALVGVSTEMRRLYPLFERLAQSDIPIVIEGETGTGKEVLAEALHERGPRREGPFVVFDCTSVPPNLVESELFGHQRGAFTGATQQRSGLFVQADAGTLLIDEIGDFPLDLQPKLLRAIDRGEVRPVGSDKSVRADVRIIAATRRDLDREVATGRFRDDLFHRLAVGRVELPPLRKRVGDIQALALHFASLHEGGAKPIPVELLLAWQDYAWPGNVRELRNAVRRYLVLGEAAHAAPSAPGDDDVEGVLAKNLPLARAREQVVQAFERRYIEALLRTHGGNVTHAARAAGVARRHLQYLKARAGL